MLQPIQPNKIIAPEVGEINFNLSKRTPTTGYAYFENFSDQPLENRMLSKIVFWNNENSSNRDNFHTIFLSLWKLKF